jgi:hypothetical protein
LPVRVPHKRVPSLFRRVPATLVRVPATLALRCTDLEKRELQQEPTCLQDRRAVTHKHSTRPLGLLGGGKRSARKVSGQTVTADPVESRAGGRGRGREREETIRRRLRSRRRERKVMSHRTQTRTFLMYPVPHAGLTSTLRCCTQGISRLRCLHSGSSRMD